ncbi:hypothetical protein [Brachyspira pilosicoli]|uniref:Uncharacterized protein n=1 Tax=Brachyspira pilosicoli (strain ATCC BAA-1826 / 95/1000) TaxID=759914 RepID=D8IDU1_BRAP9|nr:hypothetical protein [Brachyspira pilosicoli]ADK31314.1 hypothetical protein BP951000_1326 [Brachyspira pilosicoli 95/1000]
MKNKKLFITIYSILIIIVFISVLLLNILGKKERIGYLSELKLNIDKTLQINRLDSEETKKLFEINDKLDVSSITNYIFTNNSITNYSYDFRIKYYSKVFRNSDIYGVYPNIDNILSNNGFIKEINIGESGSPFGNFISTKIIDTEKIDNINYILKLKNTIVLYLFIILLSIFIILICFLYKKNIFNFINKTNTILLKNKKVFFTTYLIIIGAVILSIIILMLLGKIERAGYLSEFNLNIENTLELNNVDIYETKKLFTIDKKLDYDSIVNYIYTNTSITNYSYDFRIKYYDKMFRNSDIYSVYLNIENILTENSSIKNIKMYKEGSPFGNFVFNDKLKYDDKIDNILYTLKIKNIVFLVPILLLFILLILSLLNKEIILSKKILLISSNKKVSNISKLFLAIIILLFIVLFIFSKISYKTNLTNLELVTHTDIGYVYQAKLEDRLLFSDNIFYKYNEIKFENKPEYIKYGYNIEITRIPDSLGGVTNALKNNDGSFTIIDAATYNTYNYMVPLSKGDKYKVTVEAKKMIQTSGGIAFVLDNLNAKYYIEGTTSLDKEYKVYSDTIIVSKIEKDGPQKLIFVFPSGEISVKNIKIEDISDSLVAKFDDKVFFTSDKELDIQNESINVVYNLKLNILFILFIVLLALLIVIFICLNNIVELLKELKNSILILFNELKDNNTESLIRDDYVTKISNILFVIYIIILAFIIFSINFVNGPNNDIFWYGTNYDIFYNIYDFKGYFWQRGRHFGDILMASYMRPFGTILINVFNIDPFKSLMITKSLFTIIYLFLTSFSVSLFVWTINNKKNYRLIFVLVSLYICNYANINYYITLACYVGGFGFSMLIFYPMIYYFVYGKEILLFKNKNMNYMLYFLLLYFAAFSMEPTSTTLAGFSFFIILYLFIRNSNLFLDNNINKPNYYILFTLILTIVLTLISFSLTAFFSGRGKWQSQRISNTTIMDSIINKFSSLAIFNKILILLGILYLVYLLFILLKNKKIIKEYYIYFSISFTALFLILFFYSIDAPTIYAQLILLFALFVIILLKNIHNKNIMFSLFSNFIIFFLIFTMSLNLLKYHDNMMRTYKTTFRDWNIVIQIYKDAYNNNINEIVINKDDIENLKLGTIFYKPPKKGYGYDDDPRTHPNAMLSEFMQRYYIDKYIPIRVFYD